ncbi:NADH-quinone oxidoreductase subunit J [Skermania piniformis]|uniref:NADH-quinone oxidoreductase subunit J n=1 Tax=Skermania pinensis TaxID=39122 RepID=A0ABX8SD47_9ACTN|nr:NADH-quinone oxidoreductase subunit J [Skermania piniformis]QXQ15788.1 NADH-quinone oxidoreductase subunit J [Skermania piniformis]
MTTTGTAEAVQFWVLAVVAVVGALGTVSAPKAVYSAIFLATTMIMLAVAYIAQGALFLGVVQIVVYTGAVMMLFLFVLMLIGVDTAESLAETLPGQRFVAVVAGLGFGVLLIGAVGNAVTTAFVGLTDGADTVSGLAELIFRRYVWAFELTGSLLIVATIGAMVLAHRERLTERRTQRELAIERIRTGTRVTPLPNPGVFARHNSVDRTAVLPDGSPARDSVSAVLGAKDGRE